MAVLAEDPIARTLRAEVVIRGAIASVRGVAPSRAALNAAADVVASTPGVRGVDVELEVMKEQPRSDAEIEREVRRSLAADALLATSRVVASVERGIVRLSGRAADAATRARAVDDARLAAPRAVDAQALAIDATLGAPNESRPNDDALAASVMEALGQDPRVPPREVRVVVEDGVVTVSGTASGPDVREAAVSDARNTTGARRVVDLVKVRPLPALSDARIAESVERALLADPLLGSEPIRIAVHAGEVELIGTVRTPFARAWATRIAAYVTGVVSVDNVLAPRTVFEPGEAVFPPGP